MLVPFQKGEEFDGDPTGLITINLDHVVRVDYLRVHEEYPYHRAQIKLTTGADAYVYLAPGDADWDEVAQRLSDLNSAIRGNFDGLSEPIWSVSEVS